MTNRQSSPLVAVLAVAAGLAGVAALGPSRCTVCALPFEAQDASHPCSQCRKRPPPFERVVAAARFGGTGVSSLARTTVFDVYNAQLSVGSLRFALQNRVSVVRRAIVYIEYFVVVEVLLHQRT